jgi:hypothetical protein
MKTLRNRGRRLLFFIGVGGAMVILLGVAMLPSLSLAAPEALPIRPTPFSATATPSPTPTPVEYKRSAPESTGAFIRLAVQPPMPGLWTALQWQDAPGAWYLIEGWQGPLERDGTRSWWVPGTLFGYGPFRWVIYDKPGGEVIGVSAPFYLPRIANRVIQVNAALSDATWSHLTQDGRLLQYRSVSRE